MARLSAAIKQFRQPGSAAGSAGLLGSMVIRLPGSRQDWGQKAGDAWKNSAASIGIDWIARSTPEAVLTVAREVDDKTDYDRTHPLAQLVRRPNAYYGGRKLIQATVLSLLSDGNAYWRKVRDDRGLSVRELWYIPHWMMEPIADPDGRVPILRYDYNPGGGAGTEKVDPADVVHFRYGLDPENTRKGLGPLKAQLRALGADNEVNTYTEVVLENLGILAYVVSPTDPTTDIDDPAEVRKQLEERTMGDRRGGFAVLTAGMKIDQLGFSPEQLALDKMASLPASRILGALHIDPMTVGLTAEHSTFNNLGEAKRAAWENAVLPLMADMCDDLDIQLLRDFGPAPDQFCVFDTRGVLALQPDLDALHTRARENYQKGIWKRSESREATGRPFDADDEVYLTDIQAARALAIADRQAQQPAPVTAPVPASRNGKSALPPAPDWTDRLLAEIAAVSGADA